METERLAPAASAAGATPSYLPLNLSKKTIGVGSATFTTLATVLTVCLVLLLASDPNNSAYAEEISTPVTLHILDTSSGQPAGGVYCTLEQNTTDGWSLVGSATTGSDGRADTIVPDGIDELDVGTYKMIFYTKPYFDAMSVATFYPQVDVIFLLTNSSQHYHIPLILSPFGYTTYRGS
jgi:5-hydroxyisourate hydrolase